MDDSAPGGARAHSGRLLRQLDVHLLEAETALLGTGPVGQSARTALAQARAVLAELRAERIAERERPGPGAGPALVRRVELPADPRSAREARGFCLETADLWSLPAGVANAVTDIASELVSNACAHSTTAPVLALELGPEAVLVRVWDDGPGTPRLQPYRPGLSERGLGLRLVKQLSSHWGVAGDGGGKWVWARLPLPDDI